MSGRVPLHSPTFFADHPAIVAHRLIGMILLVDGCGGIIVETEAYDAADPASHSFKGRTMRNAAMFGPNGHAYVYRIYGLHWCLNFTAGDPGGAVLIRALEPLSNVAQMERRRGTVDRRRLCSGPGRLAQALDITGELNGASLFKHPFELREASMAVAVQSGPRIGISVGVNTPWRFAKIGSAFLSKPLGAAADRVG